MSLRNLPAFALARDHGDRLRDMEWDLRPDALACWQAGVRAAGDDDATISIYDAIGVDPWSGEGVTVKRISAALRQIGARPVTVNVNSPGGDFFEGVAIYNALREHRAEVTVRVVGLAASAASVIAMAGDRVEIGAAGFMMVHNAWALAIGNRHDFREVADTLQTFDQAMAAVYAAHSGGTADDWAARMDSETWFDGNAAIAAGLADALLPADQVIDDDVGTEARALANARRAVDVELAKAGMPRKQRRALLRELAPDATNSDGTPGAAAEPSTPRAAPDWLAAAERLLADLRA